MIEITWQVTWFVLILTSTFTFLSKALFHHIDDTTNLSEKMLSPLKIICDSKALFPLTNMYAIQII